MRAATLELVQTARLRCERLDEAHLHDMLALLGDARVRRWIEPEARAPLTAEDVRAWLLLKDAHWTQHGFGMWRLADRTSGETVGRGGLQHTTIDGRDEVEVGWAICPQRWGEGLATEMALAAIEAGFGLLGLRRLVAYALPENLASRQVMEKSGMHLERSFVHEGRPHVLYARCP